MKLYALKGKVGNLERSLSDEDQLWRFQRADTTDVVSIDNEKGIGVFEGSEGERYQTFLTRCQCRDFSKRKKPCKHMYRLAIELGILEQNCWKKVLKADYSENVEPRGNVAKVKLAEVVSPVMQRVEIRPGLNRLCVGAFVLSLVGLPLLPLGIFSLIGFILGVIGVRKTRSAGERGKVLGWSGIVLSGLELMLLLLVLIVALVQGEL